jgi:hypothetical protein
MALTPISAPTPTTPTPWYAIQELQVVSPDGVSHGWGIICERSGELLNAEQGKRPWLALSKECALLHVRYLNGMTAEFPACICRQE